MYNEIKALPIKDEESFLQVFFIAKEDCIMNKFKEFLASINWSEVDVYKRQIIY